MKIEELEIDGRKYRGILGCPSVKTPWKITISNKPGSWKTWKKFEYPSEAEAAWSGLLDDRDYWLTRKPLI